MCTTDEDSLDLCPLKMSACKSTLLPSSSILFEKQFSIGLVMIMPGNAGVLIGSNQLINGVGLFL